MRRTAVSHVRRDGRSAPTAKGLVKFFCSEGGHVHSALRYLVSVGLGESLEFLPDAWFHLAAAAVLAPVTSDLACGTLRDASSRPRSNGVADASRRPPDAPADVSGRPTSAKSGGGIEGVDLKFCVWPAWERV